MFLLKSLSAKHTGIYFIVYAMMENERQKSLNI